MTDLEWARAFVGCKIAGTGVRFNDSVDVLVKKLAEVRQQAADKARRQGNLDKRGSGLEPLPKPAA